MTWQLKQAQRNIIYSRIGWEQKTIWAPEQSRGTASEKSDQFALACIAYELFTGRLPYKEPPSEKPHGRPKPPLAPRLLNPKLSAQAERAILRALSIDLNQRYNDVSAFMTALGTS